MVARDGKLARCRAHVLQALLNHRCTVSVCLLTGRELFRVFEQRHEQARLIHRRAQRNRRLLAKVVCPRVAHIVPEFLRALAADKPYLAREYGVARYERLQAADFGAADEYYERTKKFWDDVRDAWADDFRKQPTITLRAPVDQSGLFVPLFEHAEKLAAGEKADTDSATVIQKSLQDMRAAPR